MGRGVNRKQGEGGTKQKGKKEKQNGERKAEKISSWDYISRSKY